ncbi:Fe-S cluster assembly protein SufD [Piscirickettsia litoralis]|uniref:Fe-S cluster assembly protein SufD n=1 Tax=Piscirickettsia litoralis TaxID=1891921 RepID=A0ABX3A8S8_9GAMM|nr:Fe-S cluster assembly protein SufD [Piscirickettsia litoralis]
MKLAEFKEQAWQNFISIGLPHRKIEEWKYTALSHFEKLNFENKTEKDSSITIDSALIDAHRVQGAKLIVFIDGVYSNDYSDTLDFPDHVMIKPISELLGADYQTLSTLLERIEVNNNHMMAQLNCALFEDGLLLSVPKNACIEEIQCLHISTGNTLSHYCHIVDLGENACATMIETFVSVGESAGLTNSVTVGDLAPGATLNHYKLSEEADSQQHIAGLFMSQAKNSFLRCHHAALGGDLTRYDMDIKLRESGAHCLLDGIYIPTGRQHVDNHILVEHLASHTTSEQHFKGVLDDKSHGVFNGKVIVHKDTSQIVAHQSNHNLLLSSKAEIDTKPELEIYADDVKCSHGATVGQLDEKALFYLKSRGVAESEAKGLLTHAFVSDIIAKITAKNVHDRVEKVAKVKMNHAVMGFDEA